MSAPALRIVILGGGTAGWMSACLMAKAWPRAAVTVVESPEIGIVGVGEGSTPQLKAFFDTLGIAESDWMPRAHATYKVGIEFVGWSERPGFERYFHPFATELDVHTEASHAFNAHARRQGAEVWAHPDRFFLPARLAAERLAPLPSDNFPFKVAYGYHFDAHLVGAVLRDHAVQRLGVSHLPGKVVEVAVGVAEDGTVTHLMLDDGRTVAGDLFVDSSGFRSVIAQEALGVPFLPFGDNLFNDRAVVLPTPVPPDGPACHTRSTALSAGWAWAIPLTSRIGNGYVYSSRYSSPEDAEAELRSHLKLRKGRGGAARHLAMKVGRVERSWAGNCLAVGLAQGFIEPLEATALHIVQATVEGFIRAYPDGGFTPRHREAFNAAIARRYEGVRDYIVAHYRLNRRTDTSYWRDNAANTHLSYSLKRLLHVWFTGGDLGADITSQDIARYYAPLSWHAMLAGYGTFPDDAKSRPPTEAEAQIDMGRVDAIVAGCARNFPSHRDALGMLDRIAA